MIVEEKSPRECRPGDILIGYYQQGTLNPVNASMITHIGFNSSRNNQYPWDIYCEDILMTKFANINSSREFALHSGALILILANKPQQEPSTLKGVSTLDL